MSGIPKLPGLSAFPELEKKFRRRYRELRSKNRGGCDDCDLNKLITATRAELESRQGRDK